MSDTIAVVGFGYIGAVIGVCLAERGCRVIGIDVNPRTVALTNQGRTEIFEPGLPELLSRHVEAGNLAATTDFATVAKAEYIVVTVGTPLGSDLKPDLGPLRRAAELIGPHLRHGHTVILKSTVVPRVTRDHFTPILVAASGLVPGRDFHLAFSPERIAEGLAIQEFLSLPIVVGADDAASLDHVCGLWHKVLGVQTIPISSTVGAEMVKLTDNLWIDVNIALANQVAKLCHACDVDFDEIQRAANTLPKGHSNVNVLQSSVGVGGSCLTKDSLFFASLLDEKGLDSKFIRVARNVNDSMPLYTIDIMERWLSKRLVARGKIAVLGLAFKNDTNDMRFTPVLPLVQQLTSRNHVFVVADPYVAADRVRAMFGENVNFVSTEAAVSDASILCFACGHKAYRDLNLSSLREQTASPCLFVDGRHSFSYRTVMDAGFEYQSI